MAYRFIPPQKLKDTAERMKGRTENLEFPWKDSSLPRYIYDIVSVYLDRNGFRAAAAAAYYFTFSFFPLVMIVSAILGMLHLNTEYMFNLLKEYLPGNVSTLVSSYLTYVSENQSIALVVGCAILILTMASAALRVFTRTNAEVFRGSTVSSVRHMVSSIIMPVATILVLYVSIGLLLSGNWFFRMIEHHTGISIHFAHWGWFRFLLLFLIIFSFLTALYLVTRDRNDKRRTVLPGSLAASITLMLATVVFSTFIEYSSRYSFIYGSLASFMLLLVWLYIISNIILLGNVLNYVLIAHHRAKEAGEHLGKL